MPVLAELRAVAVKRTAMQTRHEPFDHYPRDEIEIADSRQDLGRTRGCGNHGAGTASRSLPTICSVSTPSASA